MPLTGRGRRFSRTPGCGSCTWAAGPDGQMRAIDLNSDLGEGFGVWPGPSSPWRVAAVWQEAPGSGSPVVLPGDEAILEQISSASIACGFHAGDPWLMDQTVAAAIRRGVAVGAHPSYPDLLGFGLR